jgi:hypothetical protein
LAPLGRAHLVVVLCLLFVFSLTVASFRPTYGKELGGWTSTASYPLALSVPCVADLGYVYCIAGTGIYPFPPATVNKTYFAPMTATGVGGWLRSTDYPILTGPACVASAGFVYCLGGFKPAFSCPQPCSSFSLNSSYYAPLSSSGIGTWLKTTSYPKALGNIMCVASTGNIYCTGGAGNISDPATYVNASYFAQLSPTGIGAWKTTLRTYRSTPGLPGKLHVRAKTTTSIAIEIYSLLLHHRA